MINPSCPSDGYPLRRQDEDWVCTNPWHPVHPGQCGACASMGLHGAAWQNARFVKCADCGGVWEFGARLE